MNLRKDHRPFFSPLSNPPLGEDEGEEGETSRRGGGEILPRVGPRPNRALRVEEKTPGGDERLPRRGNRRRRGRPPRRGLTSPRSEPLRRDRPETNLRERSNRPHHSRRRTSRLSRRRRTRRNAIAGANRGIRRVIEASNAEGAPGVPLGGTSVRASPRLRRAPPSSGGRGTRGSARRETGGPSRGKGSEEGLRSLRREARGETPSTSPPGSPLRRRLFTRTGDEFVAPKHGGSPDERGRRTTSRGGRGGRGEEGLGGRGREGAPRTLEGDSGRRNFHAPEARPRIGRDHPPDLSILLGGGRATNRDSPSSGERSGKSPDRESRGSPSRIVVLRDAFAGTGSWAEIPWNGVPERVTAPCRAPDLAPTASRPRRVGLFGIAAPSGW